MKRLFAISVLLSIYTMAFCQNFQGVIVGDNNYFTYYSSDSCCANNAINTINIKNEYSLVVDTITGAYLIAEIISSSDDYFLVNFMPSDIESTLPSMDSVWISKNSIRIGLKESVYNGKRFVPLYNCPDYDAKHSPYVVNTASILAYVLECKNKWAKIRLEEKGTVIIGWLAPENQCVNMYTMCLGE